MYIYTYGPREGGCPHPRLLCCVAHEPVKVPAYNGTIIYYDGNNINQSFEKLLDLATLIIFDVPCFFAGESQHGFKKYESNSPRIVWFATKPHEMLTNK